MASISSGIRKASDTGSPRRSAGARRRARSLNASTRAVAVECDHRIRQPGDERPERVVRSLGNRNRPDQAADLVARTHDENSRGRHHGEAGDSVAERPARRWRPIRRTRSRRSRSRTVCRAIRFSRTRRRRHAKSFVSFCLCPGAGADRPPHQGMSVFSRTSSGAAIGIGAGRVRRRAARPSRASRVPRMSSESVNGTM